MSFQTQVEDLAGTLPGSLSSLDDALTAGAKDIIRRVKLTSPDDLWLFTTEAAVTPTGLPVDYGLIYDVSRGSKPCKPLPVHKRHRAGDADSIEFATGEFPVYYLLNGKVFVLPEPGVGIDVDITGFSSYDDGNKTLVATATNDFAFGDHIIISQSSPTGNQTYVGTHIIFEVKDTESFVVEQNFDDNVQVGYSVAEVRAIAQYLSVPEVSGVASAITSFPSSYYELVVLYGAMVVVFRQMADLHIGLPAITLPVVSMAPSIIVPEQSLATFTPPAAYSPPVAPAGSNINYTDVPDAPSYTGPSAPAMGVLSFTDTTLTIPPLTLESAPASLISPPDISTDSWQTDFTLARTKVPEYIEPVYTSPDFPSIDDFPEVEDMPLIVLPVQPTVKAATFVFSDLENLPTYTQPGAYIAPVAPDSVDVDFTDVPDIPAYTGPVAPSLPALSFDVTNLDDITDLPLSHEIPIAPETPSFSEGEVDYSTLVRAKVPQYTQPVFSPPVLPTIPSLSVPSPPAGISSASFSDPSSSGASSNQPEYFVPVLDVPDFTYIEETLIKSEEDSELASSMMQVIGGKIQKYQAELQDAVNVFNKENGIYQQLIQQELANSKITLDKENQEFQANLTRHNTEVQTYQADVNSLVQEWTKNHVEAGISFWGTKFTNYLSEYQQNISNEVNVFNKDVSEYQAEVQKATTDASNALTRENNEYAAKLQKFNAELQQYQYRTTHDVTEWQAKVVQPAIALFTQDHTDKLQEWQGENTRLLGLYQSQSSEAQAQFDTELKVWTQELSKAFQKYQAETGLDLQQYQADVQAEAGRYQSDSERANASHKAQMEKCQIEIAQRQGAQEIETSIATLEIQKYTAVIQATVQEFQTKTEQVNVDFQVKAAKWTKENIEHKFNKWNTEATHSLSEYQQNISNSINSFNKEVTEYQAEVQKAVQDSQLKVDAENKEYTLKLQKYQSDIDIYKTRTAHDVAEWQGKDVQKAVMTFQQTRTEDVQEWQAENTNKISIYQAETVEASAKFDAGLKEWSQEISKALQTYQAESDIDLKQYQSDVQAEGGRYQADAERAMSIHKTQIEKAQQEIAQIQSKNDGKLNKFQAELTQYQAEVQAVIGEFQGKNEQAGIEYQWLTAKYQALNAQYNQGFLTQAKEKQDGN